METIGISVILALLLLVTPGIASDPRNMHTLPMLSPDPSLKTSDPFYMGQCEFIDYGNVWDGHMLPPIFSGELFQPTNANATAQVDWMNLSEHNDKMNSTTKEITAASSYDLTDAQMKDVPLGEEQWL